VKFNDKGLISIIVVSLRLRLPIGPPYSLFWPWYPHCWCNSHDFIARHGDRTCRCYHTLARL